MAVFANYRKAFFKSVEIIEKYGLKHIPINISQLIERIKKVKVEKYSNIVKKYNCSLNEIIDELGDKGAIKYDEVYGRAIIYYNDTWNNPQLAIFTIAHELGHYFLEHFDYVEIGFIKETIFFLFKYRHLENEANCFARNLLSPAALVYLFNANEASDVKKIFYISALAAETRIDLYKKYDYKYLDSDLIIFFMKRFDSYVTFYNSQICLRCHNRFFMLEANYCPVCGYNKFVKKGIKEMRYSGIELDENHKAFFCPQCYNTNISEYGEYCQVCGAFIVNRCCEEYDEAGYIVNAGCSTLADGDARYCCICGNRTTFNKQGFLKNWETEKANTKDLDLRKFRQMKICLFSPLTQIKNNRPFRRLNIH